MVEYQGEFYAFDRLQMSPAPSSPVPIYVGGHTEPALRRAARADGWSSAMIMFAELVDTIDRLHKYRTEYGRAEEPFEIQAVCLDQFGIDGYRRQAGGAGADPNVGPWA